jgi:hypothetical protein
MWWYALEMDDIGTITNQVVIIIGALVTLVTAISGLVVALRTKKDTAAIVAKTDTIVEKVNGNLHEERARNQQLTALLSQTPTLIPPQNPQEGQIPHG